MKDTKRVITFNIPVELIAALEKRAEEQTMGNRSLMLSLILRDWAKRKQTTDKRAEYA